MRDDLKSYKRKRTLSHQSTPAPSMMRNTSSTSSNSGKMPFSVTGAQVSSLHANDVMLDRFYQSTDDPANANVLGSSMLSTMADISDVGVPPADFIATLDVNEPSGYGGYLAPMFNYRSVNPSHAMSACPSMASGPSAPETLSTQDGNTDSTSIIDGLEMARLDSTCSHYNNSFQGQDGYSSLTNSSTSPSSKPSTESTLFAVGEGLCARSSASSGFFNQPMERSISTASTTSIRSSSSLLEKRAKETQQRVIQNSLKTPILPKPEDAVKDNLGTTQSNHGKKDGKILVAKANYQRPTHPKVYCNKCDEHPKGFRGEHELRRHSLAKHSTIVKKYICQDPAKSGLVSSVSAIHPLNKCKACVNGKQYGAYYNAAAHLRRTHFKPRSPRGKKGNGEDGQKRGGKAGGSWPPMQEIKLWYREVMVNEGDPEAVVDADDESEDEAYDLSYDPADTNISYDVSDPFQNQMAPLSVDTSVGNDPTILMSQGSSGFEYSPYSTTASISVMSHDHSTFSPHAVSPFGSSSSTATPGDFQDSMGHDDDYSTQFALEMVY
jgi:hypothetical protein